MGVMDKEDILGMGEDRQVIQVRSGGSKYVEFQRKY